MYIDYYLLFLANLDGQQVSNLTDNLQDPVQVFPPMRGRDAKASPRRDYRSGRIPNHHHSQSPGYGLSAKGPQLTWIEDEHGDDGRSFVSIDYESQLL